MELINIHQLNNYTIRMLVTCTATDPVAQYDQEQARLMCFELKDLWLLSGVWKLGR